MAVALCITTADKAEDVGATPKMILEEVFPADGDEREGDASR